MVSGYAPREVRSLKCQALEQTQIYARTKVEGRGGVCTWGMKGRWRGSVAHHSFCQQVVIGVSVVGSEERVS